LFFSATNRSARLYFLLDLIRTHDSSAIAAITPLKSQWKKENSVILSEAAKFVAPPLAQQSIQKRAEGPAFISVDQLPATSAERRSF